MYLASDKGSIPLWGTKIGVNMNNKDWNLLSFIAESNIIEGMGEPTKYEVAAHERLLALEKLTVADLEAFVSIIQPNAILRRKIGLDVRVGGYVAPLGGPLIEITLKGLLDDVNFGAPAYEIHLRYETIHPFTDGNGRSGRAIWLWQKKGIAPLGFLHQFYYDTLGNYHK